MPTLDQKQPKHQEMALKVSKQSKRLKRVNQAYQDQSKSISRGLFIILNFYQFPRAQFNRRK